MDRTSDASTFSPTPGLVTGAVQERLPSGQTGLPVRRAMRKAPWRCTHKGLLAQDWLRFLKVVLKVSKLSRK